jgi:hypothetical protein
VTSGTSYRHTGRSAGTEYYYRVKARNSGGESDWTAEDSVRTLPSNLLPPSSGLMAVDATDGTTYGIKVSWAQ